MARTIRFHLDEHCPSALAAGLRRQGVDVTTTPEAGLVGATDEQQLGFACTNNRVIFTQDSDFLAINATGVEHPGIVYCHQRKYAVGELVQMLVLVWEVYGPEELRNRVEYI
jgi:predicted nuclease of predicted toxin-antitoxin system